MNSIRENLDGRAKGNAVLGEVACGLRIVPFEFRRHGVYIRETPNGRQTSTPCAAGPGLERPRGRGASARGRGKIYPHAERKARGRISATTGEGFLRQAALAGGRTDAMPTRAKRNNHPRSKKKWSREVTEHSDAMTLEPHVFEKRSAGEIADSLKRSAEKSYRRKSGPFQSAMSMLNFYINRAGQNLTAARKRILEGAKDQLRRKFGRS
jgi:hypothetical protein